MEKEIEKEKNFIIMVIYYLKEKLLMENGMEWEMNIIKMVK